MVTSSQWKPSGEDSMTSIWNFLRSLSSSWHLWVVPPFFETQRRILESRKDLSMKIIKEVLRQEALRLKTEQAQQPQGHLAVNLTREDSRRRKREKVWCEHCSKFVKTQNPQSCWNKPGNPDPRWHRTCFDNASTSRGNQSWGYRNILPSIKWTGWETQTHHHGQGSPHVYRCKLNAQDLALGGAHLQQPPSFCPR